MGFSVLLAASMEEFKKIIGFCDNSTNFVLNKDHSKIEIMAPEHKDNIEELCSKFGCLPIFVEFSLTGVDNPLMLAEKIKDNCYIKGISVLNDLPTHERDLPEKIIEIVQNSGFKGTVQSRVFVGFRD
jgi:hypothetical protein